MCTCISLENGNFYFGRNLDLEYGFNEKVIITPRNYPFKFSDGTTTENHYSMIGMATSGKRTEADREYPLYAEAVNEKGVGMAGLYFPGNAYYHDFSDNKRNISPYEFIPWVLSQCADIEQVRKLIENLNLYKENFSDKLPLAPLHFMISDKSGGIIVESVKDGLKVYEDEFGVLTNNPPYDYHRWNMRNYLNVSQVNPNTDFGGKCGLKPYGQGMGGHGLPGDVSPTGRFVRTVFNKKCSVCASDKMSAVAQFFRILDSAAMVRGSAITSDGKYDMTRYTCCIDATEGIYYYKTYENLNINAIDMYRENLDSEELIIYPLEKDMKITIANA